jgi:hypothetical protein
VDDAVALVENEVRELVRRRSIDPMADPPVVRRLIDEVVADYLERSAGGLLPSLADPPRAARDVYDAVAGLGRLQRYLDDPMVEEIWINGRLTTLTASQRGAAFCATPPATVGAPVHEFGGDAARYAESDTLGLSVQRGDNTRTARESRVLPLVSKNGPTRRRSPHRGAPGLRHH